MKQVTIQLYTKASDAVLARSTTYDTVDYHPSEVELAALTDDEARELAHQVERQNTLNVPVPTWASAVERLRVLVSERAASEALKAAEHEAAVQRALAIPASYWVKIHNSAPSTHGSWYDAPNCETIYELQYGVGKDPRIAPILADALAAAKELVSELCAERTAWLAAEKARNEAAKAAKIAAKAERDAAMRAFIAAHASELPANLVRASAEGRAGANELRDLWIAACDASCADVTFPRAEYAFDVETRDDVPSSEAYALHDALGAIAGANSVADWPGTVCGVGAISRADVNPYKGHACLRTVVQITFAHPWFDEYGVTFASEPIPDFGDDSDE